MERLLVIIAAILAAFIVVTATDARAYNAGAHFSGKIVDSLDSNAEGYYYSLMREIRKGGSWI